MDMLPLISVVPEMQLNINPVSGVIGAGGGDLIILSMDDINTELAKIEAATDELINSFDPSTSPLGSYPGREGSFVTAGMLTNMVYGFLIGLFLIIAAIPLLTAAGVL